MVIEVVDLPIKHGDFHSYVTVYQRVNILNQENWVCNQSHLELDQEIRSQLGL